MKNKKKIKIIIKKKKIKKKNKKKIKKIIKKKKIKMK